MNLLLMFEACRKYLGNPLNATLTLAPFVDKGGVAGQNEKASLRVIFNIFTRRTCARMAELADAPGSGPGSRKGVEVRVLFRAPNSSRSSHHKLRKERQ
jgi:hypothetical protein